MSDDSKYKLERDEILKRGPIMLDNLLQPSRDSIFWREAWAFVFELQIDLETAMAEKDDERIQLYINAIKATGNMVKGVMDTYKLYEMLNGPDESP